jgi:hypothetical protein
MVNYNTAHEEEGIAANVPMRHYLPSDRIELTQPARLPASMRKESIPGINVPAEGETWADLAAFRSSYGLPPVVRK